MCPSVYVVLDKVGQVRRDGSDIQCYPVSIRLNLTSSVLSGGSPFCDSTAIRRVTLDDSAPRWGKNPARYITSLLVVCFGVSVTL